MLTISVRTLSCIGLLAVLVGLSAAEVWGQDPSWTQKDKETTDLPNLGSNTVDVLAAAGDSLWIGPDFLGLDCLEVINRPAPDAEDAFVFSIEARNETAERVWAGLAFDVGGGELGAGGFLVSNDGGSSFERRDPQLDASGDAEISYGGNVLEAEPITQQAGSVPQDLAFGPGSDTVWVAGRRSGLRWIDLSTPRDEQSWTRAVLPPDSSTSVDPANTNDFLVAPPLNDGRGWRNHEVFRVLVDEEGVVWAGTPEGLNRSRAGSVTATGQRAWDRFEGGGSGALLSDVVVALAEQPRPGRNPIWVAAANRPVEEGQRFGVAVTDDGGSTFRKTLIGERVTDLATRQARVYAVGREALYVTADQGNTWRTVENFPLKDEEQILPDDVTLQAVATTNTALWVGMDEGLLRLDRADESSLLGGGSEWTLFRAETPVDPGLTAEAPDVSTYAYPNPFVPSRDEFVRIAYELKGPTTVEINIYDFGMNRVRTITDQKPGRQQKEQRETVWRGTNGQGLRVPTGTYFYTVDLGGRMVKGKILVAN
ncbi:MAG: hypothetical protein BRD55_11285 [Bacteroidetes bacterium SW_9_63_38]|nr:MAG: hypothetical protein BRD55_11285 [Bacteroidetes bacterium SW_9_63_38]